MPPPPWKKARLSPTIMSDHNHITSPTHSASFVDETGFPTSLVDLFVMNSHRMMNTSSAEAESESDSAATTPRSPLDSLRPPRRPVSESISSESKGCFWLWWIFKVFFVVVLAMALAVATEQLAVGITVSAFSLLVMELFGNYILKPWLYSRKSLKNNNNSSSSSIESESKLEVQIEENDCNADSNVVETPKPNTHLRLPSGEIRAMKSILSSPRFHRRSSSDGMGTAKDLHAFKSFNLNWFSEESKDVVKKKEEADNHPHNPHSELDKIPQPLDRDHDHDRVPNQIVHKSNSRKIKSKIKKFVKKLKSSKKELTDRRSGASSAAGPPGGESESIFPSIKLKENNRESLIDNTREDSQVTEMEDKLSSINNDGNGVEGKRGLRRRKSTYCVAMLAVVLAGLVGGRFCGIAFTVIWCSVMKMMDKEGSIGKLPPVVHQVQ